MMKGSKNRHVTADYDDYNLFKNFFLFYLFQQTYLKFFNENENPKKY